MAGDDMLYRRRSGNEAGLAEAAQQRRAPAVQAVGPPGGEERRAVPERGAVTVTKPGEAQRIRMGHPGLILD
eukprot:15476614-Alexandrium_andersonii.AAC.1